MDARTVPLRLLAAALCLLWLLVAAALFVAYRPGGPYDVLVALAAALPAAIAALGIVRPPIIASRRGLAAVGWVGVVGALLIVPTLTLLVQFTTDGGRLPLRPSFETGYAAAVALAMTCFYVAFGLVRRGAAVEPPRRRTRTAVIVGLALLVPSSAAFGGAVAANDSALRTTALAPSPAGPTDPALPIPACGEITAPSPSAVVDVTGDVRMDGALVGTLELHGVRSGADEAWTAQRVDPWLPGTVELVDVAGDRRMRDGAGPWRPVDPAILGTDEHGTLDQGISVLVATSGGTDAAEDMGIELIDGARARQCRILVTGPQMLDALPILSLLASPGAPDRRTFDPWRGDLMYWVFADGHIGRSRIAISGYPPRDWRGLVRGMGATIAATVTAYRRGEPLAVGPAAP